MWKIIDASDMSKFPLGTTVLDAHLNLLEFLGIDSHVNFNNHDKEELLCLPKSHKIMVRTQDFKKYV